MTLNMIFHANIIIQLVRSFPGKSPLPFNIEIAALAEGPAGYPGPEATRGCQYLEGVPLKKDIRHFAGFIKSDAMLARNAGQRSIYFVTADAEYSQRQLLLHKGPVGRRDLQPPDHR